MGIVTDYSLGRQLNHAHDVENIALFLLKSGDTATGTIHFPLTDGQGCALISSINASTSCQIEAVRISIQDVGGYYTSTDVEGALQELGASVTPIVGDNFFRRVFLLMGA